MADSLIDEVIRMVDKLEYDELEKVMEHIQARLNRKKLTKAELRQCLDAMTLDVGEISPDFSFNREDWYGDDGR